MSSSKPDPIIEKKFKSVLKRDVLTAVILLIPISYIIYSFWSWKCIMSAPYLFNLFVLSVVILVLGIVFEFANWKCPKCKKYIGMVYYPRYCPRCGERFR